jgi:hypothetical protein
LFNIYCGFFEVKFQKKFKNLMSIAPNLRAAMPLFRASASAEDGKTRVWAGTAMFIAVPDRFESTQAGAKCLSSPSLHDSRANEMIGGGETRQRPRQTLR